MDQYRHAVLRYDNLLFHLSEETQFKQQEESCVERHRPDLKISRKTFRVIPLLNAENPVS